MHWKIVGAILVIIGLLSISFFEFSNGTPILRSANTDGPSIHDQIADLAWIFFLCLFSLAARFRKSRRLRYEFLAIAVFLFVLAAIHSHSLWSFSPVRPLPRTSNQFLLSRIYTVPGNTMETGLRMRDAIQAMSFDSYGDLWLTSPTSGPYVYSVKTNEVENILRPDYTYGLVPDPHGMWLLTSTGASLYSGVDIITHVHFPEGVIPLSGGWFHYDLYFGTTRGLFCYRNERLIRIKPDWNARISGISAQNQVLILLTDWGIFRYANTHLAPVQTPKLNLIGVIPVKDEIFGATDGSGLLIVGSNQSWSSILFASTNLNVYSREAICMHRGKPFFGSFDGSIVTYKNGKWNRIVISDWPVTSLASNGESLFAWSNGSLYQLGL